MHDAGMTDVDVLIIGAGVSGICAAAYLRRRRPASTVAVLEARADLGGTWDLFRYPGVRSDSDMASYALSFKPWLDDRALADGARILDYLREVATEQDVLQWIRFSHRVVRADFQSDSARWLVQVATPEGTAEFSARFLFVATGYFDYEEGHRPDLPGSTDFAGRLVHPQHWPDDLDCTDLRVVVIGSGATAVTLIPALARRARHVTMLQRSPSYLIALPSREKLAEPLRRVLGPVRTSRVLRLKNIVLQRSMHIACRRAPALMRRRLIEGVRHKLPRDYDVDTHFTPRYQPWDERLCVVPSGDLFRAIRDGSASVVTDRISRLTHDGVLLESGRELPADVIVTATGLRVVAFGKIQLAVDGTPVDPAATMTYKSCMLSGVPNLVFAFGYTNLAWTLKIELTCRYFLRLLRYLDAHRYASVCPPPLDPRQPRKPLLDLQSGYARRAAAVLPAAGTSGPWSARAAYFTDFARLRVAPVRDPALRFRPLAGAPVSAARRQPSPPGRTST